MSKVVLGMGHCQVTHVRNVQAHSLPFRVIKTCAFMSFAASVADRTPEDHKVDQRLLSACAEACIRSSVQAGDV